MQEQNKLLQATTELEACRIRVAEILKGQPVLVNLAMRADSTLVRLINGLGVSAGLHAVGGQAPEASTAGQELTHIFGVPIGGARGMKKKDTEPTPQAITDMEHLAGQVITDIREGALPADVIEKHGALAIRAAATIVGYPDADNEALPQLVIIIFNTLTDKDTAEKQVNKADAAVAAANAAATEAGATSDASITSAGGAEPIPEADAKAIVENTVVDLAVAAHEELMKAETALVEAKNAKTALPVDAAPQQKALATKAINAAILRVSELEAELNTALDVLDDIGRAHYHSRIAEPKA